MACRNILKKYHQYNINFVKESNEIADLLEELDWGNINEKYEDIEQACNKYYSK